MSERPKNHAEKERERIARKEDQVVIDSDESFPASDPVAVGSAAKKAAKREPDPKESELKPKRRPSPDWLLHPPRR